jgi:hypothetical protein
MATNTPLTSTQLAILLPGVPVIEYGDLDDYNTVDDACGRTGMFLLFFQTAAQGTGHWSLVLKNGTGQWEYYDSYGMPMDAARAILPAALAVRLDEARPQLSDLFKRSGIDPSTVALNSTPDQRLARNIATCGDHSALRASWKRLGASQYQAVLTAQCARQHVTPDQLVAAACWSHLANKTPML